MTASRLRGGGHETVFSSKFLRWMKICTAEIILFHASSELGNDGPNDNVPGLLYLVCIRHDFWFLVEQASNQAAGQNTDANQGTANAGRMAEDSKSLDLEFTSSSAGSMVLQSAVLTSTQANSTREELSSRKADMEGLRVDEFQGDHEEITEILGRILRMGIRGHGVRVESCSPSNDDRSI